MRSETKTENALERLVTVQELADAWKVSASFVYKLIRGGALPSVRVGGVKIRVQDAEAYIASLSGSRAIIAPRKPRARRRKATRVSWMR